jgi:hypothetical protein
MSPSIQINTMGNIQKGDHCRYPEVPNFVVRNFQIRHEIRLVFLIPIFSTSLPIGLKTPYTNHLTPKTELYVHSEIFSSECIHPEGGDSNVCRNTVVGFELFTVVAVNSNLFLDMTPCSPKKITDV